MSEQHQRPPLYVCGNKPSTSFSAISRAGSATSASSSSSRSGGSKLLFGEIDTSSDRSSESYASVCSFVLCDSGTFLTFWLNDQCRDTFLSFLSKQDLARLRLACHDFSVRAAPLLFRDLSITFRTSTFTRPARLSALDRLGFHVKTLSFTLPHSHETFLPPLVDPETGAELSYTYTPQLEPPSSARPKYGDVETTEILIRQYPPLFHAATNVSAFIRAFSALVNLQHLKVACPDHDPSSRYRRNVVDFMLISLRIAVEQNCLNALDSLTLSHMHPGGLLYLSPVLGYGATPRSASRWARLRNVSISLQSLPPNHHRTGEPDQLQLLQTYLRNFSANLRSLHIKWEGEKGAFPISSSPRSNTPIAATECTGEHPAFKAPSPLRRRALSLSLRHFPQLHNVHFENMTTTAEEISAFVATHKRTLVEINMQDFDLAKGTWDEALLPLTKDARAKSRASPRMSMPKVDLLQVPILLSPAAVLLQPTTFVSPPRIPRKAVPQAPLTSPALTPAPRRTSRLTSWLPTKPKTTASPILLRPAIFEGFHKMEQKDKTLPSASTSSLRRVKENLPMSEGPLKKVLHRVHWI